MSPMEKNSSSGLTFAHISKAVEQSLSKIDGRRKGTIKSLQTGFPKLDKALLDGVEWNRIFTIAGMSGSGKSILLEQLKRSMCLYNDDAFDILSFEFEMPAVDQMVRNLSAKTGKSYGQLMSAEGSKITDKDFQYIQNAASQFKKYPIFTVDEVGTVLQIMDTIKSFVNKRIYKKDKGLVVTIDHVLLTAGKQGQKERELIADLYRQTIQLKKALGVLGIPVLFIFLSQFNRGIEITERLMNPELHYPTRNDLFGSNDIFMCSDYVLMIHKPAVLKLKHYGLPKGKYVEGLPVYNPDNPKQAMVYLHMIKQRFGEPRILMMLDEFHKSKISEF